MKKICLILLAISGITFAQFKDTGQNKVPIARSIVNDSPSGFITSFLNSNNFKMTHSFGMSYTTFSGHGISLGTYTNTMSFQLAENMSFSADVSMVNTPYNTLGDNFTNSINGIYLSRASFNWSPTKNSHISIQYNGGPFNYPGYGYYGNGFMRRSAFWDRDWDLGY